MEDKSLPDNTVLAFCLTQRSLDVGDSNWLVAGRHCIMLVTGMMSHSSDRYRWLVQI
jgi:hypothetical protein